MGKSKVTKEEKEEVKSNIPSVGELREKEKEWRKQERYEYLKRLHQAHTKAGVKQVYINPDVDQLSNTVKTHEKMGLTKQEAVQMALQHRYFSRRIIGEVWGIEYLFFDSGDKMKVQNIVKRIFDDVVKNREYYGDYIDATTTAELQKAVQDRAVTLFSTPDEEQGRVAAPVRSIKQILAKPIEDMVTELEDTYANAIKLLKEKTLTINTRKDVAKQDILKLANTVKVLGEQTRLAKGQATEHVAHVVKAEGLDEMSPEALMKILSEQYRAQQESNTSNTNTIEVK